LKACAKPSIAFGAKWLDKPLSALIDALPEQGASYNMRVWEMQCCNANGMSVQDWYCLPIGERTWKVASMMVPTVIDTLRSMSSGVTQ